MDGKWKNLPDILITDIRMPGRNGIELVKKIREEGWEVRVIVLSGYNDLSMSVPWLYWELKTIF